MRSPWRTLFARWLAGPSDANLPPAAPALSLRAIFRRFWPETLPYRRWLWLLLLLAALTPAVDSALIWLFKRLVDDVLVPRDFRPFGRIALAYLGLSLLGGGVSFGDNYVSAWVGERFLLGVRTGLFRHLHQLPLDFLEGRQLGDVLSRLTGDVAAIEGLVLSSVVSALTNGLRLLFFAAALFFLAWRLALVALVVAPLFWWIAQRFSGLIKAAARQQRRASGSISALAEESLANSALVQAYNRQAEEVARFQRAGEANLRAQLRSTRLRALFSPLVDLVELAGVLVVVGLGTWQLARGELTLGGLLVFLAYLSQLYSPIRRLSRLLTTLHTAAASAERIAELLDQRPTVASPASPVRPLRLHALLAFEHVTFRYPARATAALEDVSFQVGPGETLAIVGASGAGKSTVAKLLLRFYDPSAGRIACNGDDLRAFDLAAWREQVAVLFQEALLFDGSVRENIAFGHPGATEAAVLRAALAADAHDFIQALPDGYDTTVGQKGRRLSGGQRQRIAIARAIVRDAPILLLDEPTTGLDAESAHRILEPLRRLAAGRTTIIITHQLALARAASRVLVLERGRLVECGTHGELLERGGTYGHLVRDETDARQDRAVPIRLGTPG